MIDSEETLTRASPAKTFGTQDQLSLNTIMELHTARRRHSGSNLTATGNRRPTSADKGVPVAPLRTISDCQTVGTMIEKMEGEAIYVMTGEKQTIMTPRTLRSKLDQTPGDMATTGRGSVG